MHGNKIKMVKAKLHERIKDKINYCRLKTIKRHN